MNHPPPSRTVTLGRTTFELWDGNCGRTTLPDGVAIMCAPEDNEAYRERARDLGYGNSDRGVFRMSWEHDLAHAVLAELAGLPESPALRSAAWGTSATWVTDSEEGAVMAFQQFCNMAGVDLFEVARRLSCRPRLQVVAK